MLHLCQVLGPDIDLLLLSCNIVGQGPYLCPKHCSSELQLFDRVYSHTYLRQGRVFSQTEWHWHTTTPVNGTAFVT